MARAADAVILVPLSDHPFYLWQAAHCYVEHIHATEAAWPELVALFP